MRSTLAILTLAVGIVLSQNSQALTVTQKDFPKGNENQPPADANKLPDTVAIYQNKVVLLAGSPDSHTIKAEDVKVDPVMVETITEKAGKPVTLEGITAALQGVLKDNASSAVSATAAALKVAKNAGFDSDKSLVSLVVASIQALNAQSPNYVSDVAILIGLAVATSPLEQRGEMIRQLRSLAITQSNAIDSNGFALSLDQALSEYHVVESGLANESLQLAAANFMSDVEGDDVSSQTFDLDTTIKQIENGTYSPGDGPTLALPITGGPSGTGGNPALANNNTPDILIPPSAPVIPPAEPVVTPPPTPPQPAPSS